MKFLQLPIRFWVAVPQGAFLAPKETLVNLDRVLMLEPMTLEKAEAVKIWFGKKHYEIAALSYQDLVTRMRVAAELT